MPALPLDEAGKYVAGAYIVFLAVIVIYVSIMATKLRGLEQRWRRLEGSVDQGDRAEQSESAAQAAAQASPTAQTGPTQTGNAREG